jgi:hypothetical protein
MDHSGIDVHVEQHLDPRSEAEIDALRVLAPAPRPQAIGPPAPHVASRLEPQAQQSDSRRCVRVRYV